MVRLYFVLLLLSPFLSFGDIYTVDPNGTYKTVQSISALVDDGDTIYIKPGVYVNQPQVYFTKNNLFISGLDGRPRLEAGSTLANKSNGKALFVISGANCIVEHIEFANAKVPDRNGAGIRQEGCDLTVQYCYFLGNEMGILGGNYSDCKVTIEHCVFSNNGSPSNPGFQHNVYINHIDTLVFQYNYTINAIAEGHELKSRAHFNLIRYNYIGNLSSNDSRNIDLPNGGTTILVGNVIEQSNNSVNSNLVGYGLEGLTNTAPHNLWVVNNTFVNRKDKGSFVQVAGNTDTLYLKNNILVGRKTGGLLIGSPAHLDSGNNVISDQIGAAGFENSTLKDYHLTNNSICVNQGTLALPRIGSYALKPFKEYDDTASFMDRKIVGSLDIGAYEFDGKASTNLISVNKLSVYPNPVTNNMLFINRVRNTPFEIVTIEGKSLYSGTFVNGIAQITGVSSGVYLLVVGDSKQLLCFK
ncbi:MAG: hypothetical protein ACI9JN_000387 [Bacteroidia bacterium]|jgi:hypothetical protein